MESIILSNKKYSALKDIYFRQGYFYACLDCVDSSPKDRCSLCGKRPTTLDAFNKMKKRLLVTTGLMLA